MLSWPGTKWRGGDHDAAVWEGKCKVTAFNPVTADTKLWGGAVGPASSPENRVFGDSPGEVVRWQQRRRQAQAKEVSSS